MRRVLLVAAGVSWGSAPAAPDDAAAFRREVSESLLRMGDVPSALRHARRAAELSPADGDARDWLARVEAGR